MKTTLIFALCVVPLASSFSSCREKGPAEKAGEQIDKAGRDVKDAVDPPKTPGEKLDHAIDKAKDKLDQ